MNPNYGEGKGGNRKTPPRKVYQANQKSNMAKPYLRHAEKEQANPSVCRQFNAATVTDVFPLPFIDGVLDAVADHECYIFLDVFSGYNQIRMHPNDQE